MGNVADFRPAAYLIIVLGSALATAVAVVPHYTSGHRLLFDALLLGLLPYLVYGGLSEWVRGWPLLAAGVLLLAIELGVRVPARLLGAPLDMASGLYYVPPLSALVVLPLVLGIGAWRQRQRRPASEALERATQPSRNE